jgi:hypothetical protein
MTERTNVPVLKTGVGLPTVGSNPTPSATQLTNTTVAQRDGRVLSNTELGRRLPAAMILQLAASSGVPVAMMPCTVNVGRFPVS